MTLGQRIKALRKQRKMTQVELAVEVHLSPSYISAIEQNVRQPSLRTLNKIGRALGVPTKKLL